MSSGGGDTAKSDSVSVDDSYADVVRSTASSNDDDDEDYSSPARNFEIDRGLVELHDIIGEGQFGDVHKGTYYDPAATDPGGGAVPVAVKTCKIDGDFHMTEKFLEEACEITYFATF